METKKFFDIFAESFKDFARNPSMIASGVGLFIFVYLLSRVGGKIAYSFQTSFSNTIWIVLFFILILAFGAFTLGGVVGRYKKNREDIKYFLNGKRFWLRNFLILITFAVLYALMNLILFLFTEAMVRFSSNFSVSTDVFRLVLFLISFAYFAGVIIFFSFSGQMVVLNDFKFIEGLRASFRFVKENYLTTLALNVIIFVLFWIFNRAPETLSGFLSYAVFLPFYFVLLTRFVLISEKK